MSVRVDKVSGIVEGPCAKCGKGPRGIVMFEDNTLGAECVECGHVEPGIDAEFVEDKPARDALEKLFE